MTELFDAIWQCQLPSLSRNLEYYIEGLGEDEQLLRQKTPSAEPLFWAKENSDRLFDFTCHPSQMNMPLRVWMVNSKEKLRNEWRMKKDEGITQSEIEEVLKQKIPNYLDDIYQKISAIWQSPPHEQGANFIPSIHAIGDINLSSIKEQALADLPPDEILDGLLIRQGHLPQPLLDEVEEVSQSAKNWLLNGNALYTAWLDYDGAKRPAGLGYAVYSRLLMIDIRRSYRSKNMPKIIEEVKEKLDKIDMIIHGLSLIMAQENNREKYEKLDAILRLAKKRRFHGVRDLVRMRNDALFRRDKKLHKKEITLSKRIRFAVRIDAKTADTAVANATQDPNISFEEKALLENICLQIKELNELSSDDHLSNGEKLNEIYQPICLEVMIANAGINPVSGSPQDIHAAAIETVARIKAVRAELAALENYRQVISESRINTIKYTLVVPLFETPDTITPQFVTAYLDVLWNKIERDPCLTSDEDYTERRKIFHNRYRELFFAGSDSSRAIGSYSAKISIAQTIVAVHRWAENHGVTIDIKIGSGESAFRQDGYFDMEEGSPIYCQKGKADEKLWQKTFGKNWQNISKGGMGFAFTLLTLPGVNGFTVQARANEQANMMLHPKQMREKLKKLYEMRHFSLTRKFDNIDAVLLQSARIAQTSYQAIIGHENTEKPNGLASYPALVEYLALSGLFPVLRERGLSRQSLLSENDKLKAIRMQGGINCRAIAATHAASLLFPLLLIEKGDILAGLENDNQRKQALSMVVMRSLLRESKIFKEIAPPFFDMLEEHPAWHDSALELRRRWQMLQKYLPLMREVYLTQEIGGANAQAFYMADEDDKKNLISQLIPSVRELLDDDYTSLYTKCYMQGWQAIKPFLKLVIKYLGDCEQKTPINTYDIQLDIANNKIQYHIALCAMATGLGRIG
jgi:hypothetical protein